MIEGQRKKKQLLSEITIPMHETAEAFRITFEKEGVEDTRTTGLIRGIREVDETMQKINDARPKILNDRTLNEPAKKVEFYKYSTKIHDQAWERMQTILKAIDKHTDEISAKVDQPIHEEAMGRESAEIRKHVKSLPATNRMSFVKGLIEDEDWESASACLGRKHFLAGLSKKHRDILLNHYKQARFSEEMRTQAALNKIGKSIFHKIDIMRNHEKSLKTGDTLRYLETQKLRQEATER